MECGLRNGDQEKGIMVRQQANHGPRFDKLTASAKARWPNEPTASQNPGRVGDARGVAS